MGRGEELWQGPARWTSVRSETSKMDQMSETSAGSLGSMSDGELLHALDQSESSVVLGGYAGLVKPIEQAEKLGGVAAIVRACSVVYIAYICQNIYIGCIVHRQKSNEEKS